MTLSQLIYSSEICLDAFDSGRPIAEELETMLQNAQRQNRKILVTGILLYSAGHFLQILEGHPLVVRRLYAKISTDPRHRNVEELAYFACGSRMFDQWFMGMLNLDEHRDIDPALFHEFREQSKFVLNDQTAKRATLQLLKVFRERLQADQPVQIG